MSVLILGTTEQIYRNAPENSRSELSYLCVAVAGMFLYDLALHVAAISGQSIDAKFRSARGFVNALFAIMLGVRIRRALHLSFDAQVPRQIIIY